MRGRDGRVGVGGAAGRGGEHAHEIRDEGDGGVADFGVGGRIGGGGQGRTVLAALAGMGGGCDPHLVEQGQVGEVVQGGHVGLASEAPHAAVGCAPQSSRDAVAVAVVGIGGAAKVVFRHQVGRSQAEEKRDREGRDVRGRRRDRVALCAEAFQCGGRASAQVLAAFPGQDVTASVGTPPRGLDDELLAGTPGRGKGVTGAALVLVEERPDAFLDREDSVEERLPGVEAGEFVVGQPGYGVTDLLRVWDGRGARSGGRADDQHGHGRGGRPHHTRGDRLIPFSSSRRMKSLVYTRRTPTVATQSIEWMWSWG